jgi:penicillin G amidase
MPRWLKISITVSVTLIILITAAGFIFYNMLTASLPQYDGEITAHGISDKVEVYGDSLGVPYILANNEDDAAFALGYLHAQERMFQMDLIRRAGAGRLSEILGPKALIFDKLFRTVGIEKTSQRITKILKPEVLKLLESYSAGVNQYLKDAKGKYSIEFDVLRYDPYEWKPEDCIIISRMMAWELNISWWTDISFTDLVQKLGEEKVKEILPDWDENAPYIIPPEIKSYPKLRTGLIDIDKNFRNLLGINGTHLGSNNWVVDSSLSVSGKPIIANDPHLGYSAPGRWYTAVIRAGNWNVEGVTIPGIPAVVIGKNQNISWALTNIMLDDADFYIEKLDSSGTKYLFNNSWKDLTIAEETIKVKDSLDVKLKIRSTHRGPLISDVHPYSFLYPDVNLQKTAISMRWVGMETTEEMNSFYLLNRAKNWSEFKEAVSYFSVPGQNFVYADKSGNIGYVFGAKLPKRESTSPTFVFDGTTDKYDWKGYVDRSEIPDLFNPKEKFIASANNKTLKDFKYHISNLWEPSSRIERIDQLLTSKGKFSSADFMKFQMDQISPYAKMITQYILSAFSDVKITDENLALALELFKDWNYDMNEFSQVPTIYSVFFKYLLKNTFYDEMGEDLYNQFVFVSNVPYRSIEKMLKDKSHPWFDNINTPQIEDRDFIIRKSLVDALSELEKTFGKDITEWQWGKLHTVTHKHPFSGQFPLIDKYIDIGPFPIGGDGTTIFNTEYPFYDAVKNYPEFNHTPFEDVLGPSMRYIFDFSKPDEFYLILTTGESGNVMSKHYRDMTKMWLRGNYMKIRTDEKSIRRNKISLEIIPK